LIRQKKVEKNAQSILDISKKITESAIGRRNAAKALVENLDKTLSYIDGGDIQKFHNESTKQDELRSNYRKEVKKWNKELTIINIDLYNIGLADTAFSQLEGKCDYNMEFVSPYISKGLHADFFKAHLFIDKFINSEEKNKKMLDDISEILDVLDKEMRNLSKKLVELSNEKWDSLGCNFTEPLSENNYKKASTWILFIALFYKNPSLLRINSPEL
jgi:soluble cytochrome b562